MSDSALFKRLKFKANGMLDPQVYAEIHRRSASAKADIVEVGTAHGAATIALALGASNGIRVKTIEKFEGGSRVRYGSVADNLTIIAENFAYFGVSDRIDLFVGTPETTIDALGVDEIGLLLIDADGCIDRDFRLYYDMLQPGAPIIVDDYRPRYIGAHYKNGGLFVDQKHRITTLLIDLFETRNLIERDTIVNDTYFGRKPRRAVPLELLEADVVEAYRNLIFARTRVPSRVRDAAVRTAKSLSPELSYWLKMKLRPTTVR